MNRGSTLIEILAVVAIISIISSILFFSFSKLNDYQAIDKETLGVISVLNNARSLTLSSKGGTQYGVHIEEDRITLFKGGTYSSSDPENVTHNLNTAVHISSYALSGGGSDIIFERLTGGTDQNGTITLSLRNDISNSKIITIFVTGTVQSN